MLRSLNSSLAIAAACGIVLLPLKAARAVLARQALPDQCFTNSPVFSAPVGLEEPGGHSGPGAPEVASRGATQAEQCSALTIPPSAKVLIVAPHPDDEILAAGGLIQRVVAERGAVRIVYVSNGDGYFEAVATRTKGRAPSAEDFKRYGRQRRAEAIEAQLELGVPPRWLTFLGFPDGGIHALWGPYRRSLTPYVSPFTLQDRSAENAALEYRGAKLETELYRLLLAWKPDIVVAPDPRDVHSDHCAVGLFVLDAVREANRNGSVGLPTVLGYLVHFSGYPGDPNWPHIAKRSGVCGGKEAAEVLSHTKWLRVELEEHELKTKQAAMDRYTSQIQVMRPFLEQFSRRDEWFSVLERKQWDLVSGLRHGRLGNDPGEGCSRSKPMIGTIPCRRSDG